MEPTDAQAKRIKNLRDVFGRNVIKPHAPDAKTGILRVEASCAAGVHQWYFDADGEFIQGSIDQRLFDLPEPTRTTRNAIDN